jgi:hypothetical protein
MSLTDEPIDKVDQLRQSEEYKLAKAQFNDRKWRLNHLYYIQDKDGNEVQFKLNIAQQQFYDSQWYRDIIVKARQLGFSTLIEVLILDDCLFRRNTRAAIIDATLGDAKKKLAKIKFAYDRLPYAVKSSVGLKNANTEEIKFTNGSEITIGTSFRGDTPQVLHVSEYGKIALNSPETANAIKTGAFNAVAKSGKVYVESTAHGAQGEFYEMVERAKAAALSAKELATLEFKLHFFAWWMDPGYRLPPHQITLTTQLIDYFQELEVVWRIKLDDAQKAWYAQQFNDFGADDMRQEYPSTLEECFHNSLEGSFFKHEMTRAREDKRIGLPMPYDPSRPVNTFWDIGMDDENCIIWHQTDGIRNRMIDFYKNSGEGLPHYVQVLRDRQERRKFIYGKHYGPHDLKVREWSSQAAKPRFEIAKEMGLNFVIVPRIEDKADAIEACRRFINTSWFDSVHCGDLIKGLDNYRKKWNKTIGAWSGDPVHDAASHVADAMMTGAVGLIPDRLAKQPRQYRFDSSRTGGPTSWSA